MRLSVALGVGLMLPVLGASGAMATNTEFMAASVMQWEAPAVIVAQPDVIVQAQAAPQPITVVPRTRKAVAKPKIEFQMPWQIGIFQ